jgi:hypothetical protein
VASSKEILAAVASVYGITKEEMLGMSRKRPCVVARQCYCYILNRTLGFSPPEIAKEVGMHRTTVIYSIDTYSQFIKVYPKERERVARVNKMLNAKESPDSTKDYVANVLVEIKAVVVEGRQSQMCEKNREIFSSLIDHATKLIEALCKDKGDWIEWWLYEDVEKVVHIDGKPRDVEDVYSFLDFLNNK